GLKDALGKARGELTGLGKENGGLKEALGKAKGKLAGMGKEIGGLKEALGKARGELAGLGKENGGLKKALGEAQGKLAGLGKENGGLKEALGKAKGELAGLGKENNDLKGKVAGLGKEVSDLQNALANKNDENGNLGRKIASLGEDLNACETGSSALNQKVTELGNGLDGANKKLNSCLAEVNDKKDFMKQVKKIAKKVEDQKKNLRANIARNLADKFRNNNIDAAVDPKTGNVTLLMDKNLLFETGSSRLSKHAKKKLKSLIPLYSEVLFADDTVREQLDSFNVEGHASPLFGGKALDPMMAEAYSYNYNLNLSSRRALAISNYIYSDGMNYPYKFYMRNVTKSIGYGFSRPIPLETVIERQRESIAAELIEPKGFIVEERKPASFAVPLANEDMKCGQYSCSQSQRVELSFTLKDDPKAMERLLQLSPQVK
ncbi:OmpA family protein, partial [Halobacteriovorax sp. ZH5_bin.2]|uniref:OmpA family protein n=1 Tax=Halobacteriovorax sp. ZH5_bin.2 TaxID=3157727 RepID=UPI00372327E6